MKQEFFRWYSPNLSMDMEMLVFGHAGYPVVLFPTSMGRYYENKDFGLIESVKWYVDNGLIKIYCPDSMDRHSWYNKSIDASVKVYNHVCYDKMIREELVERVRFDTAVGKVVMAGCSFGGYHAINFAFRHPGYVSHVFSMSGAFDIKSFLHGHYDDNVFYNNPMDFLPGAQDGNLWNMDIVLGTSDWDICLDDNIRMSELLNSKGINHWLDVRKWAKHDWPLWKMVFPHYLSRIKFN